MEYFFKKIKTENVTYNDAARFFAIINLQLCIIEETLMILG